MTALRFRPEVTTFEQFASEVRSSAKVLTSADVATAVVRFQVPLATVQALRDETLANWHAGAERRERSSRTWREETPSGVPVGTPRVAGLTAADRLRLGAAETPSAVSAAAAKHQQFEAAALTVFAQANALLDASVGSPDLTTRDGGLSRTLQREEREPGPARRRILESVNAYTMSGRGPSHDGTRVVALQVPGADGSRVSIYLTIGGARSIADGGNQLDVEVNGGSPQLVWSPDQGAAEIRSDWSSQHLLDDPNFQLRFAPWPTTSPELQGVLRALSDLVALLPTPKSPADKAIQDMLVRITGPVWST